MCEDDACGDGCCGRGAGRVEGDDTDSEGGCEEEDDEGPLLLPWNSFLTSNFAGVDGLAADVDTDANEEGDGFPLTAGIGVACALTVPNVFGGSALIAGTDAGEEDNGADTSSIEPKVTAEPRGGENVSELAHCCSHVAHEMVNYG